MKAAAGEKSRLLYAGTANPVLITKPTGVISSTPRRGNTNNRKGRTINHEPRGWRTSSQKGFRTTLQSRSISTPGILSSPGEGTRCGPATIVIKIFTIRKPAEVTAPHVVA
jgi:hypothetical protein